MQQQNGIYELLRNLEETVDKGFHLLSNYLVVVKKDAIEEILDRIYASLPTEVQEARALLRRREELQLEAQQRAEKIITDAQAEASRYLSESELIQAVKKEAGKVKEQVMVDCNEIKRKALDDAENLRIQATDEALRIKDGASAYAEELLVNLEQCLNKLQQEVKNGQVVLEKRRSESSFDAIKSSYNNEQYAQSFDAQ